MQKRKNIILCIVFFLMVYGISMFGLVQKERSYSSSEKRILQTFPKISAKRIINGKFQKKYETYLSDQFPARDQWIWVKSAAERLAGKTESNQVFFGKNHYLLEKYTKKNFSKKQIRKNIQALAEFVEEMTEGKKDKEGKTTSVKVLMVPSKTNVLKDYLPLFAESYDETIFYEMLKEELPEHVLVPVKELLREHKEEYIYYRNDHHWTTLGAWYGYKAYMQECGTLNEEKENGEKKDEERENEEKEREVEGKKEKERKEEEREDKEREAAIDKKKQALKSVSTDFLGTTYAKVNMYSKMDEIFIYEPEGEFSVLYNRGEKTEDTFYQWEYLEKDDQYSVFSGGNQGILEITGGEANGKTLMVIKDSFANCIVPFFMEDYENVVVVDMRQINAGLSTIMRMYQPSHVLVLYNIVQFMQDSDFSIKP